MATEHLSPTKIIEGIIITVVGGIILFFLSSMGVNDQIKHVRNQQ